MTDIDVFYKENRINLGATILMKINSLQLKVTPYLSVADLNFVSKNKVFVSNRNIINRLIANHVQDNLHKEKIKKFKRLNIRKNQLLDFIYVYVKSDDYLQKYFDKQLFESNKIDKIYEAFIDSIEKANHDYNSCNQNIVRKLYNPNVIANINKTASLIESLSPQMRAVIGRNLSIISLINTNIGFEFYSPFVNHICSIYSKITQYVLTNNLLTQNNSLFEKVDLAEKWGMLGWTIFCDDIELTEVALDDFNYESATKAVLALITDKKIEQLKENLMRELNLKCEYMYEEDITEAFNNYYEKRYKSCALLVFALIDGLIIRKQIPCKKSKNGKKRKVCNSGAKLIIDQASSTLGIKCYPFICNLYKVFNKLFCFGDDFSIDQSVINRNLLVHGMLKREVTKADCIQIFYLLLNFLIIEKMVPDLDVELSQN